MGGRGAATPGRGPAAARRTAKGSVVGSWAPRTRRVSPPLVVPPSDDDPVAGATGAGPDGRGLNPGWPSPASMLPRLAPA